MSYEPEGLMEQLGAKVGLDSRQVGDDLKRFKQLVETTGCRDRLPGAARCTPASERS